MTRHFFEKCTITILFKIRRIDLDQKALCSHYDFKVQSAYYFLLNKKTNFHKENFGAIQVVRNTGMPNSNWCAGHAMENFSVTGGIT